MNLFNRKKLPLVDRELLDQLQERALKANTYAKDAALCLGVAENQAKTARERADDCARLVKEAEEYLTAIHKLSKE